MEKQLVLRSSAARDSSSGAGTAKGRKQLVLRSAAAKIAALVQEQQGVEKRLVLRSSAARDSSSGAGTAGCGKAASVEVFCC